MGVGGGVAHSGNGDGSRPREPAERLIDRRAREILLARPCTDCPDFPPGKCPACFVRRLVMGTRCCGICAGPRELGWLRAKHNGRSFPICEDCLRIPAHIRAAMPPQFVEPSWRARRTKVQLPRQDGGIDTSGGETTNVWNPSPL